RRLPRLGRGPAARPARADAAGALARHGAGRDPRAHHPLLGARSAARGLRAYRARQGRVAARRAVGPRAAQCADPGHHGDGPAVRGVAGRHDRGGERVLPAGAGPPDLPVDRQPRPDRGAQLRDAARRDGGAGELRRRRAVRRDRPAREGERPVSAVLESAPLAPSAGPGFWARAVRPPRLVVRLGVCLLVALAAALSFVWTPHNPYEIDLALKLRAPDAHHWLGTDAFGRDIASLLLVGARASIVVGVIAVGIGLVAGTALGLLASAKR